MSDKGSYPSVDEFITWEDGGMDPDTEYAFFEQLATSGLIYGLQGMYGRRARDLGLLP